MSLERLELHRRIWSGKPALRDVYGVWFDRLLEGIPRGARVLEVGAGPGLLSGFARRQRPDLRWIASDLLVAAWNDVAADAERLPLAAASVDGVVGLDVVHHLRRPAAFLAEAARVLRPGGRLSVLEPWVTPLSYPIYRWLHQEGCRLGIDPWNPFGEQAKDAFDGNAAVLWRLVQAASQEDWRRLGLTAPSLTPLNAFAYLFSLGFRQASLLPRPLARPLLWLDRRTQALAPWLGMRVLAIWRVGP